MIPKLFARSSRHRLAAWRAFFAVLAAEPGPPITMARITAALNGEPEPGPVYPYPDGDVTVLGPEIFASEHGHVICWRGANYLRQDEPETGQSTANTTVIPGDVLDAADAEPYVENEALRQAVRRRRETRAAQQPKAQQQWCKCPSCWGWFVEEHPGEDLDSLGKDLGWWSGLPEHRDAPAPPAPEPAP